MVKRNEAEQGSVEQEQVVDQVEGSTEGGESADGKSRTRKIGGFDVAIPQPYREGHTLTAGEAVMVNSAYAEAFVNNLRDKLKAGRKVEGQDEPVAFTQDEAQAIVDEYAANYVPGSRPERAATDPREAEIERETRRLAETDIANLLREQKLTRKQVNFKELVTGAIAQDDSYKARATELVDARRAGGALTDDRKAKLLGLLPA